MKRLWLCAIEPGVVHRSLIAAAVVGTLLNLINQGDAFLGMRQVDWLKIGLTYLVPYFVSTYGAVSYRLALDRAARASRNV